MSTPEVWFFKPTGLLGYGTTFVTGGKYCHCGFAHTIDGVPMFTDATVYYGVGSRSLQIEAKADAIIALPGIDNVWLTQQLMPKLGRPYGYLDALGFVIGGTKAYKGIICTELVLGVFTEALGQGMAVPGGVRLAELPQARTAPSKLFDIMNK